MGHEGFTLEMSADPDGSVEAENLRVLPEPLGRQGFLSDPRFPFHGAQTGAGALEALRNVFQDSIQLQILPQYP